MAFDRARTILKVIGDANPTLIMIPACSAWIDGTTAEALIALKRDTEALTRSQRARAAREILIKANPATSRGTATIDSRSPEASQTSIAGRAGWRTRWRHSSKGERSWRTWSTPTRRTATASSTSLSLH